MKKIRFYLILCTIIFGISCQQKKEAEKKEPESQQQQQQQACIGIIKGVNGWQGQFKYLLMPKADIKTLFATTDRGKRKKKKIVFHFKLATTESSPILIAFGVFKHDEIISTNGIDLTPHTLASSLVGEMKFGQLELSRSLFRLMRSDYGSSDFTHLLLIPKIDSKNYVTYSGQLVKVEPGKEIKIIQGLVGRDLNPCPPAKPCGDGDCDTNDLPIPDID